MDKSVAVQKGEDALLEAMPLEDGARRGLDLGGHLARPLRACVDVTRKTMCSSGQSGPKPLAAHGLGQPRQRAARASRATNVDAADGIADLSILDPVGLRLDDPHLTNAGSKP